MALLNYSTSTISRFIGGLFLCFLLTGSNAQENWSDPATWGGTKPIAGENVTIPSGTHIVLDEDTPDLGGLTIEGKLEFAQQDLNLTADWIMVMGTLEIGTDAVPYTHKAIITLNALDTEEDILTMGTRGILVMGGSLEMHGNPPPVPWTKINVNAPATSTALTLMETVNWNVNDEIIIGPTDFYGAASGASITQKVSLTNVNGMSLDINAGLNAYRWGQLQYTTNSGMSLTPTDLVTPPNTSDFTPTILDERAPVGHLTRNIVVQAPDDALWQNDGFGCHIMIMRMGMDASNVGEAHLNGVEIRRAGQRGKSGRYPFHWHMLSYEGTETLPDITGQYIQNSVINESKNRGIVIHGTNGSEVSNNVVYNVLGHAIFLEDASERRNVIDGNLILHIRQPEMQYALKNHEVGGRGSSGFWISNPDNTVTNNMAGDCMTNGFWLSFPDRTWGLSSEIVLRPDRLTFGVFENNTAHSNGAEGFMLDFAQYDDDGNVAPRHYGSTIDGEEINYITNNQRRFLLKGLSTWKNNSSGFWDRSLWPDNQEIVSADNCFSFFAGAGTIGLIERCLVIGNSLNHLMNGTDRTDLPYSWPPAAFATYHGTFSMKDNIVMNFPAAEGYPSGAFATNDYYIRGVEKGQIRNTNNLIIASHPGVKLTADQSHFALAGALWDPHGVWGGNSGDYLVYDTPFFTHGQTPTMVNPDVQVSGGVLVEGPFYDVKDFIPNLNLNPYGSFIGIDVTRFDESWNSVGTWSIDEAMLGQILPNMRHFAAHHDSPYLLEFPNETEVWDVGVTIACMLTADDYLVLGMEYSGNEEITQVYFTSFPNHFFVDPFDHPESDFKHIYQPVADRQAVLDAPTGKVYWQDTANDIVWLKIQGGLSQYWPPGANAPDSDEEIYWRSWLRIYQEQPLSVDVTEFSATLQSNETVKIDWTTASEMQHDYFLVQRSADGTIWEDWQKVQGIGNSNSTRQYSLIDQQPLKGVSFYRLQMVAESGKHTYSDLVTVEIKSSTSVELFPNPAADWVHLSFSNDYENVSVEIRDIRGRLIATRFFEQPVLERLNVGNLEAGIYLVKVIVDEREEVLRLVKQ